MFDRGYSRKKVRLLALSLGLFLFACYLLIYRGGFHSVDEVSMFAVTESLVKFGRFNTDQIAWTQWTTTQAEAQGFFGRGGHVYSKKGLALSLVQAPLYWLAWQLPGLGMLQTVSILNAILTAATAMLLFLFVVRLGFSPGVGLVVALGYGLATIAFVYAKYLFSEPLAAWWLLLAAYMLLAYRQEGGLRHVVIGGLAAGLAVLTRANNLFLLPVFGLYLLWIIFLDHSPQSFPKIGDASRMVVPVGLFVGSVAVSGLLMMGYNALRSGHPLQTGYDLTLFSANIGLGLYKLLFSPLRGLFVYSPLLLLSGPGWWLLRQKRPAEAWLFAGLVGVTVGLFSAWSSGEGLSWGSRFLVPVVPFLALSLAPLLESVRYRAAFFALLLPSFAIQLLGAAINPWVSFAQLQAQFGGEFFLERTPALYDFRYSPIWQQWRNGSLLNSDLIWWQPAGFDGATFGLGLALAILAGWLLWRQSRAPASRPLLPLTGLALIVTYIGLARAYQTDHRQFGPPDGGYIRALNLAAVAAGPEDRIVTVAPAHYHIAMNRFKAALPVIGLARQSWPPPDNARPLLRHTLSGQNGWLVTVGLPPAAPDNAAERWLSGHAFKLSDRWLDDARLVRYSMAAPDESRAIEAALGETVRLESVRLTVSPAETLPVESKWRAIQPPGADYNIFIQLLDETTGLPVAQNDGPPGGGYAPTSGWSPGRTITDRRALALPPDGEGRYRLIGGMHDPATGQRLRTATGQDFVDMGVVTLK